MVARKIGRTAVGLLAAAALAVAPAGCEGESQPLRQPGRPSTTDSAQPAAAAAPGVSPAPRTPPAAEPPALARAMGPEGAVSATRPSASGLFLDRPPAAQFRLLTYNVSWDSIFPTRNRPRARRFARLIRVLDPDVLALQEIRDFSAADIARLLDSIIPLPESRQWQAFRGESTAIASRFPLTQTAARLNPHTYRDPAIAVIDLPDDTCPADLCLLSSHFKCCEGHRNDPIRQRQADGIVSWLRAAYAGAGEFDLPACMPVVVAGDLNLVGGRQPMETLLTGDIQDEAEFGPDFPPDWDGTELTDAHPLQNGSGPADYTWRKDRSGYDPGRLDFVIYSDSVLEPVNCFILNTTTMSAADLATCGLERTDVAETVRGGDLDHLPVVVDFRIRTP